MNRNLNIGWLLATIALALVYAACRIITWNNGSPAWAATLQHIALVGAFASALLMRGDGFTLRNLERHYENRARRSLVIGAVALLILPLVIWLVLRLDNLIRQLKKAEICGANALFQSAILRGTPPIGRGTASAPPGDHPAKRQPTSLSD